MRIKIEQWLFVPVPACHWSRMNNSAPVVEVRIREKKGNFFFFGAATIQAIFKRGAVSGFPAALTLSSPSPPASSRSSHQCARYHMKIEQILLCLACPWEGLHTKQMEDGIGVGGNKPRSLCSFASPMVVVCLFSAVFVIFLLMLSFFFLFASSNPEGCLSVCKWWLRLLFCRFLLKSFDGITCNRQFISPAFHLKDSHWSHSGALAVSVSLTSAFAVLNAEWQLLNAWKSSFASSRFAFYDTLQGGNHSGETLKCLSPHITRPIWDEVTDRLQIR